METRVTDMELMQKMMAFMRKARMDMGGHGMPGMRGMPPFGHGMRGPAEGMPPFGRGMRGHHGMPPFEDERDGGFGRGPMGGRRPPLSREHLLVVIGRHPEGIRQKDIAAEVGINQSSASELIDKLEGDGYIARKVDPGDRRATLLSLTELGAARAAEVEDERRQMFRGIFDRLTDGEREALSRILDKLLLPDDCREV